MIDVGTNNEKLLKDPLCECISLLEYFEDLLGHHKNIIYIYNRAVHLCDIVHHIIMQLLEFY